MVRCEALTRTYVSGGQELAVVKDISFALEAGGFLAIVGPSGSGKSTLLGLLAGLDRPGTGAVYLDGQDLGALSEDERARLRADKVGFVFQSFHLIPTLTAHHYPAQLSGGEQQRVAIARAFAHRPRVLFADEPTGNLDAANGAAVIELMTELNRELGTTVVLVTHDPELAARARRVIRLSHGSVVSDGPA
jgi:putative ABC transport system ATP-binding protein